MRAITITGAKHDENLTDVADIARYIRATIKAATKTGMLPADWKYKVTIERYAGGQAINVKGLAPRPTRVIDGDKLHRIQNGYDAPMNHPETGQAITGYGDILTVEARKVAAFLNAEVVAYDRVNTNDQPDDYYHPLYFGHATVTTAAGVPEVQTEAVAA